MPGLNPWPNSPCSHTLRHCPSRNKTVTLAGLAVRERMINIHRYTVSKTVSTDKGKLRRRRYSAFCPPVRRPSFRPRISHITIQNLFAVDERLSSIIEARRGSSSRGSARCICWWFRRQGRMSRCNGHPLTPRLGRGLYRSNR